MKILRAKPTDAREYIKMRKESMKFLSKIAKERITLSEKELRKEFDELIKKEDIFIYFLEEDKNIIGFANILWIASKKVSYLNDILIKEKFRGKGYGKILMDKFMDFSKKKGAKKLGLGVRVENKNAIRMYEKYGFKTIGLNMGKGHFENQSKFLMVLK